MRGPNVGSTERARGLRRRGTRAELVLWRRLRDRQLAGCKFVRQEPIGRYFGTLSVVSGASLSRSMAANMPTTQRIPSVKRR
ncbi:MAG TPA: DUF559 domain-containing protein [Stellaceae bacterium]|nr:DUF559 domain-containing protein [Stellaceae bacterium]